MKYFFSLIILLVVVFRAHAQIEQFPKIQPDDIEQHIFTIDSSATAVVLMEKGETFIESSDADRAYMVFHNYKIRIKILKQEGYDEANFTIPLYKFGNTFEYVRNIKGSSANLKNGKLIHTALQQKNVFYENNSEYLKLVKFTLPDIVEGSIIDVEYTVVSPDIFNFRTWNFQSNLPKLSSEYNVRIPAVYNYNVVLKGALKLNDTKSYLDKQCLFIHNTRVDCSNITYSMNNIPAFKEEAFMLAPKNYLSAVYFELIEAYGAQGNKQSFTKKWTDVDRELLSEKSFGGQLKRGNLIKEIIDPAIFAITDKHERADKIYHWIQQNIKWNNYYGKYSQNGVDVALRNKNGNIADINLALIAVLNAADIEAYPILVSSRENGLPHDLHPVISDFNYVIAGVKIDGELIQLDASDKLLAFGQLPIRAINGQGRIIYSKKSSEWIPLENKIVSSTSFIFNGKLGEDGKIRGKLNIAQNGLDAYHKRKEILNFNSIEEYEEALDSRLTNMSLESLEISGLEESNNILLADMDVVIETGQHLSSSSFVLNPIFIERTVKNPFNLDTRFYPVDLGARKHESYEINIEVPEGMTLISGPSNNNLTLPNNSARYLYRSDFKNNTLSVIQRLSLAKPYYSEDEYFGLKELYSRMIQQQKIDFNFKK